jgi:hypothetical protein
MKQTRSNQTETSTLIRCDIEARSLIEYLILQIFIDKYNILVVLKLKQNLLVQ